MTKAYLPEQLEEWMLLAIDQKVEGPKVDFKQSISFKGEDFAELLKDICAIANTDDQEHFGDEGFLLTGVARDGTFHSLPEDFDADKLSASVNEVFNKYVAPPLNLRIAGPYEHTRGKYAVLHIPISRNQPHMIIKETGNARPGQWWIRVGDTTALAGPQDYIRVLHKTVSQETRPLEERLTEARALITNLEQRLERLQIASMQQAALPVADAPDLTTAAKIRAQYGRPETPLLQALRRELIQFLDSFEAEFPDSSVEQVVVDWNGLKDKLEALENLTRPLGEALVTAVALGNGELDDVVGRVLVEVMQKTLTFPKYNSMSSHVEYLRAYPLVLLSFGVCAAAIQADRTKWLPKYLKDKSRQFNRSIETEVLESTRSFIYWEDIFITLYQKQTCSPAYQHLVDVIFGEQSWFAGLDPFSDKESLVAQTELLQSLIYMDGNQTGVFPASPIPNTVVYSSRGNELLRFAIQRNPQNFRQPLNQELTPALEQYLDALKSYGGGGRRVFCAVRLTNNFIPR